MRWYRWCVFVGNNIQNLCWFHKGWWLGGGGGGGGESRCVSNPVCTCKVNEPYRNLPFMSFILDFHPCLPLPSRFSLNFCLPPLPFFFLGGGGNCPFRRGWVIECARFVFFYIPVFLSCLLDFHQSFATFLGGWGVERWKLPRWLSLCPFPSKKWHKICLSYSYTYYIFVSSMIHYMLIIWYWYGHRPSFTIVIKWVARRFVAGQIAFVFFEIRHGDNG